MKNRSQISKFSPAAHLKRDTHLQKAPPLLAAPPKQGGVSLQEMGLIPFLTKKSEGNWILQVGESFYTKM